MIAFGMPGMTEWLVILVIVLIFFGAGRLPDVMKQLGKGVREFKDASDGAQKRFDEDEEEGSAKAERTARRQAPRQIPEDDELDDAPPEGERSPKKRSTS